MEFPRERREDVIWQRSDRVSEEVARGSRDRRDHGGRPLTKGRFVRRSIGGSGEGDCPGRNINPQLRFQRRCHRAGGQSQTCHL